MWCGLKTCICVRWVGFKVQKWEGKVKNFAYTSDELLRVATGQALHPDAPLDRLTAVLRYFVETSTCGSI